MTYRRYAGGGDVEIVSNMPSDAVALVIRIWREPGVPGFRGRILATASSGPADLETANPNDVGGDIAGGRNDLRQLFTRPAARLDPYSTPDPTIFLCSASTPPGGGVHGMCGHLAALAALGV